MKSRLELLIDDIKSAVDYDIDEDALKISIKDGETTAFYFTVYIQRGQRKNYNHSVIVWVYGNTFDELAVNGWAEFDQWKKENGLDNQQEDKSE